MKLKKSRPVLGRPQDVATDDSGFSFVELLIVIVIIGILTTIVVVGVRGVTDRGSEASCAQERHVVATAIESYFAQHRVDRLPGAAPADAERFERGLVSASVIRGVSSFFDVEADGSMVPAAGSPCA